jgi:hypothetical protein
VELWQGCSVSDEHGASWKLDEVRGRHEQRVAKRAAMTTSVLPPHGGAMLAVAIVFSKSRVGVSVVVRQDVVLRVLLWPGG